MDNFNKPMGVVAPDDRERGAVLPPRTYPVSQTNQTIADRLPKEEKALSAKSPPALPIPQVPKGQSENAKLTPHLFGRSFPNEPEE